MTVKEMFEAKYKAFMKKMNERTWCIIREMAEFDKCHPSDVIFREYLSITEADIKEHGGWGGDLYNEIKQMHGQKLLASNIHRQYNGRVIAYWLTKKGLKQLGL